MALSKIDNLIELLTKILHQNKKIIEYNDVLTPKIIEEKYIISALLSSIGIMEKYNQIFYLKSRVGILENEIDIIKNFDCYFQPNLAKEIEIKCNKYTHNLETNIELKNLTIHECFNCDYISLLNYLKKKSTLEYLTIINHPNDCVELIELLKTNPNLKSLYLGCFDLSSKSIDKLSEVLNENTTLQHLTIKAGREINIIFNALRTNKTLQYLNLSDCIGVSNCYYSLPNMLKINKTLKYLNLSSVLLNTDDDAHKTVISSILKYNNILEYLILRNNKIRNSSCNLIADNLKENTSLLYLDISNNCIKNKGFKSLVKMLMKNKTLQYISFNSTTLIKKKTCDLLGEVLQINNTLQHLNLSYNILEDKNVIFKSLRKNSTLKYLELSCNQISDCFYLKEMIMENTTLTHLDLSYNEIDIEIELHYHLINALKKNNTLEYLNISNNLFSYKEKCFIADMLKTNNSLKYLIINDSGEYMPDEIVFQIMNALELNNTLQCLILRSFIITNDNIFKFIELLNKTKLHYIEFKCTNDKLISQILEKIQINKNLKYIKLFNGIDIHPLIVNKIIE